MTSDYTRLHKHHHADYDTAKEDIRRQIGTLDLELFNRDVLCGVYVRPLYNPRSGFTQSIQFQKEEIIQSKIVLVLKLGPSAFKAPNDYPEWYEEQFGTSKPPSVGDWLMVRAADGHPTNICGDDGVNVMYPDKLGREHKAYEWDSGWPCRIISDQNFMARVLNPHTVV